ncbi:MAG: hypothetical protein AVDCRST_MAG25-3562, partial [uncultured Rubrobacteraceae bacterium]
AGDAQSSAQGPAAAGGALGGLHHLRRGAAPRREGGADRGFHGPDGRRFLRRLRGARCVRLRGAGGARSGLLYQEGPDKDLRAARYRCAESLRTTSPIRGTYPTSPSGAAHL